MSCITNQREQYLRVTRKEIATQARLLIADENFKASRGWVSHFMHRSNLVARARTTTDQRLPPELTTKHG